MAFLVLLIFGLVVLPFFALGIKRHWLVAAVLLAPVIGYATYLWILPIDPTEDEQMVAFWRMLVLAIALVGPAAFGAGIVVARLGRRRGINLEETFE